MNSVRILCLGDVVGSVGRKALKDHLSNLKKELLVDLTIVNAENSCGGLGLDAQRAFELRDLGIDCMTLGDHAWAKKEIISVLKEDPDWLIRPINYPKGAPGMGFSVINKFSRPIVICNLLGRVFMDGLFDCPFRAATNLMEEFNSEAKPIFIFDIHAEASSEKIAFSWHVDGEASLVFGTHTHVQTADERISEKGTASITDLGMCGSSTGVIGMDREVALYRFRTAMPKFYEAAKGEGVLKGVLCEIDLESRKAISIARVSYPLLA
jgi:metallophosphoesterase (TIGR00282 family)